MQMVHIGDRMVVDHPIETEIAATGAQVTIPAGTNGIVIKPVNDDQPTLLLENGLYGAIEGHELSSEFNATGIANWVYMNLNKEFALAEGLCASPEDEDAVEYVADAIIHNIEATLYDLGFTYIESELEGGDRDES